MYDHYSRTFHKLFSETQMFFYGNLTLKQADAMSTSVIEARKEYLERIAFKRGVVTERNELLEEWFLANPAERIVALEKALALGGDGEPDGGEGGEEVENKLSVILEEGEGGDVDPIGVVSICIFLIHSNMERVCAFNAAYLWLRASSILEVERANG